MYQAVMEHRSIKSKTPANFLFVGVVGGFVGGFLMMLTGLILSGISLFTEIRFHGWELVFMVSAFPLFAVGAHFLDRMDVARKAAKIELCRKQGLTGEQCK